MTPHTSHLLLDAGLLGAVILIVALGFVIAVVRARRHELVERAGLTNRDAAHAGEQWPPGNGASRAEVTP